MGSRPSLDDYIDVAERIQNFKDDNPDGSLQTLGWEVVTVKGHDVKAKESVETTFIVYRAAAFRSPDDPTPGHGIAWEPFPGRTPYTKDSELMNAETAAWGRAICALGLVANQSLASRQEVRNRRADQDASQTPQEPVSVAVRDVSDTTLVDDPTLAQLRKAFVASGKNNTDLAWCLLSIGVEDVPPDPTDEAIREVMPKLTFKQAFKLEELLKGEDDSVPGSGE